VGTIAGLGGPDTDADCDGLLDQTEVRFHGTQPSSSDSDGDGCIDGYEVADVNGNRVVNVIDLSQLAAVAPDDIEDVFGVLLATAVNRDLNRSGAVDVIDLAFAAKMVSVLPSTGCAQQGGVIVTSDNDGVTD
jgi:hypothetical protein